MPSVSATRLEGDLSKYSDWLWAPTGSEAHSTSYPMRTGGSFWRAKRPGRKAYHSPPPNADVKDGEVILPFSHTPS
jgi:hypothetical protein